MSLAAQRCRQNACMNDDRAWMKRALELAQHARAVGEVPVGALVVRDGAVLGEGWNRPIAAHDPTAHAEIIALRAAGMALGNYRLPGATLYATLEPCLMCAGAMLHARIDRLVFGTYDPKAGAVGSVFSVLDSGQTNHRIAVFGGVREVECGELLRDFFKARRLACRAPEAPG
jgi:tRNA(adenine34) deaminase